MPPWLDTPEEAGAVLVAVLGVLGTIGAAIVAATAAVIVAGVKVWRSKIKPLLTETQVAATHAADQLTPNHGSTVRDAVRSTRDAVRRTEEAVARLDRNTNQRIGDLRADVGRYTDQNDRAHSEIFKRIRGLESPMEDTRP